MKVVLYEDEAGRECITFITHADWQNELDEDDTLKIIDSFTVEGDYSSWPVDRFLIQE